MILFAAPSSDIGSVIAPFVGVAAVVCFLALQGYKARRERKEAERLAAIAAASRRREESESGAGEQRVTMSETDRVLFEQHKRMNELTIAKLEAEVALMQAQLRTRVDDDDRMHAAKEFHELSVEKTKLEIDSLRLHIAEQRKRIDDWGLGGGG